MLDAKSTLDIWCFPPVVAESWHSPPMVDQTQKDPTEVNFRGISLINFLRQAPATNPCGKSPPDPPAGKCALQNNPAGLGSD